MNIKKNIIRKQLKVRWIQMKEIFDRCLTVDFIGNRENLYWVKKSQLHQESWSFITCNISSWKQSINFSVKMSDVSIGSNKMHQNWITVEKFQYSPKVQHRVQWNVLWKTTGVTLPIFFMEILPAENLQNTFLTTLWCYLESIFQTHNTMIRKAGKVSFHGPWFQWITLPLSTDILTHALSTHTQHCLSPLIFWRMHSALTHITASLRWYSDACPQHSHTTLPLSTDILTHAVSTHTHHCLSPLIFWRMPSALTHITASLLWYSYACSQHSHTTLPLFTDILTHAVGTHTQHCFSPLIFWRMLSALTHNTASLLWYSDACP